MHKRVIIQQCYVIKNQVVIRKNIINAKANIYQQNKTILLHNFIKFVKT